MLTKKDSPKNESKTKAGKSNANSQPLFLSENNHTLNGTSNPIEPAKNYSPTTRTPQKTKITIKYDVGFTNYITIRGKGANLNWDKGQPLKNVKSDEWIWETDAHFNLCEFKVLINDQTYEKGENHLINCGSSVIYTPRF